MGWGVCQVRRLHQDQSCTKRPSGDPEDQWLCEPGDFTGEMARLCAVHGAQERRERAKR